MRLSLANIWYSLQPLFAGLPHSPGQAGLACLIVCAGLASCSTLSASWYLDPNSEFAYHNPERDYPSARFEAGSIQMEIWSGSGSYNVLYGPPLVPCLDTEPPILNQSSLHVQWRITPPKVNGRYVPLRLPIESRKMHLSDGRSVLPQTITTYVYQDGSSYANIDHNFDADVAFIPIVKDTRIALNFFGIYYADLQWFEIQGGILQKKIQADPPIDMEGEILEDQQPYKVIAMPTIRFTPRRTYDYEPFEIPLAYPGPR